MRSGWCDGWRVAKHHQLTGLDGQQGVSPAIAPREFHFKSAAIVGHYDRAHLTATQQKRRARLKVRRRNIFKQRDDIMHLNFTIHNHTI
jgi:hypothetical protein